LIGDGTFDVCRTERVLRYLDRPQAALAEMARVTRPGGSVLAFDFDSDMTIVDAPDPELPLRIARVLDAAVPHPWIGRQLFGLFQRAGLSEVRVIPHAEVATWWAGLERAAEAGAFFAASLGFIAAGRKHQPAPAP
jgi:ubiquinone/menaquinone biosynthesis C-methylase UbiE